MIHRVLPVGPLQCNCQLVACPRTKEAVLVDPGDEAEAILALVAKEGVTVKYLLHTHAHFDHCGATGAVKTATGAVTCLHDGDRMLYENLPMQGRMFGMHFSHAPALDKTLEDGEPLRFGDCTLEVLHTPGHSPGSVCFRFRGTASDDAWLASGDTLFQGSIGRADLWGGNGRQLLKSIRERLFVLEDDLPVYPGHGGDTRIGVEKRTNPFFQ
jgi:glyoxylase-like metal-dependent hydrolase (beta-lactamase superfamily II)